MNIYHYHLQKKYFFKTSCFTFRNINYLKLPFFFEQTFSYILNKSEQKREASNPPVPALISTMAFLSSSSSLGNKNNFNSLSYFSFFLLIHLNLFELNQSSLDHLFYLASYFQDLFFHSQN